MKGEFVQWMVGWLCPHAPLGSGVICQEGMELVGAPGCPTPPVDSCVWGLLPPGSEELPRRKNFSKPCPQEFPWESKGGLAISCSARKAPAADTGRKTLLLVWQLAIWRAAKLLHVAGRCHTQLRGLCCCLCWHGKKKWHPSVSEPQTTSSLSC